MGGYGGKAILINVEDSRIVILHSQHYNHKKFKYNHKKLLINPIILKTIGKSKMPGKYKFDSDQITKIVKKLF